MDLVFTVGAYEMLAMAFRSFGIELDDDLAPEMIFSYFEDLSYHRRVATGPGGTSWRISQSRRRAAGPSTTPSSAPDRCPTRTRSRRTTTSSSARPSSPGRWLNVGRVEQLPRNGSYFTKELDAAGTSLVIVRGKDGDDPCLPQHLPSPGEQARLDRLPRGRNQRDLPPVHLQVPRLAVRHRGPADLRPAGVGILRPRQATTTGWPAVQVETWEGFIFVNLDPENTTSLRDYLGEFGSRPRRLPVRQDDPGLQVPGRHRCQLEAVHRRLRRVLPRTRSSTRSRPPPTSRASFPGTGTRRWPTSSTDPTAWCRRGAACPRPRTSTW